MNAADVIAYVACGEVACPECAAKWESKFSACGKPGSLFDPGWHDCGETDSSGSPCHIVHETSEDEAGVVFADQETDIIGSTCGDCQACYGPDGWDQGNPWRWSRCDSCNSQRPWRRDDSEPRLLARQGELQCTCCLRNECHF